MSSVSSPASLTERLRAATAALHRQAERSGVMATLLAGRLEARAYAALLHDLLTIYRALERGLVLHASHPAVALIHDTRLTRSAALDDDLARLCSAAGLAKPAGHAAATLDYVERLNTIGSNDAQRLVAHAYVRYLGDLNGGQVLRSLIQRSPQLAPYAGTRFHDFGDAAEVARLAGAFRAGLAQVGADAAWSDAIVEEACWSFRQHVRVFEQLAEPSGLPGATRAAH